MTNRRRLIEQVATGLTKELTDQGKLIEAGFAIFADYEKVTAQRRGEMKIAFMAGAEHVFSSIMNMLDPGEDPTGADLRRMDLIAKEIESWRAVLSQRIDPAQGNA